MEKYGIPVRQALIAYVDKTVEGGHQQNGRLLDTAPGMSAAFVTNYEMTLGALIAVNERGIAIPKELSLIGFDNLDLSMVARPRLTIVSQPLEEIGIQAARLMLERLSGEKGSPITVTLSSSIQEGESVRRL